MQTKTVVTRTTTTTTFGTPSPKPFDLSVYVVIDVSTLPPDASITSIATQSLLGGATILQLRAKDLPTKEFVSLAQKVSAEAKRFGAAFVINDRIDVALAVDADGVHIGQDDMPLSLARTLLGPTKIIGITCTNPAEVVEACANGADYLGTCAVFPTATKVYDSGFVPLGAEGLKNLMAVSSVPVVAIGGINGENLEQLIVESRTVEGRGVAGIAVVSAVICAKDVKAATEILAAKIRPLVSSSSIAAVPRNLNTRSPRAQLLVDRVATALGAIRKSTPLVHCITNYVVMNDNANVLLAIGASPIMAHAVQEATDITSFSGALVLNIGTLSEHWIEAMHLAGKTANAIGIPVVMDPVGAGATPFRQKTCVDLATLIHSDIIKGNAGEISFLAKTLANTVDGAESRGVDSMGPLSAPTSLVRALASKTRSAIAMSGPVDYISDRAGRDVVAVSNGNDWLGKITGTGCDTTTLVAAFAAVVKAEEWKEEEEGGLDPYLVAGVGGLLCMCVAAELAVKEGAVKGPMSFKTALFDAIAGLTPEMVQRFASVEFV
ncbi:hypothetical protein HDU98_006994 [Podochytrium sp. JEL0797]|nr:hypothetical protein HDU98_006994 [Podochytrium sp. JEL0797]